VILPDANLLLFAYNSAAVGHTRARQWWEQTLNGPETVGLAWQTITAFIRITTNLRAFARPLDGAEACEVVTSWINQPVVQIVVPGPRHWSIFNRLIVDSKSSGPMIMDAHLAALAIEHGATLCSNDRDFARFDDVRLVDPLR
jgi:hypothetical protein